MKAIIRIMLAITALSVVATACSARNKHNPGSTLQAVPSGISGSTCSTLTQAEIESVLPAQFNQYDIWPGTYSPDDCHYALTMLSKGTSPSDAALIGTWIIDTKIKSAQHIVGLGEPDYIFATWISNEEVRLGSDNHDTTAIYDLARSSIIKRDVINIMFRFHFTGADKRVVISPENKTVDPSCTIDTVTNGGFVSYPLSCVQQSNIIMTVFGYKTFALKYLESMALDISGRIYQISDHGMLINL